jgi:O-antigen biosynthesis protein
VTMACADVSVVICAYTVQRWEELRLAVSSVLAQELPPAEVFVVIDHNEELLVRATAALEGVKVMPSSGPKGLSGARNTGVEASRSAVVAFLDDDATAEPDWIARLVAPYGDPDVLGVGGWAEPVFEGGTPKWLPEEFYWVIGCSYRGLPVRTAPVRNLIGCNMSVRRDVLMKVGGFDTALGRTADRPLGCEETELCIRATDLFAGGRFVLEPSARVHHSVPAARCGWRYFRDRCRAEGVSKAWVSQRVGRDSALASERSHALKVLPLGMLRHLLSVRPRDLSGASRAAAIVAGLYFTSASYLRESRRRNKARHGVADALSA